MPVLNSLENRSESKTKYQYDGKYGGTRLNPLTTSKLNY